MMLWKAQMVATSNTARPWRTTTRLFIMLLSFKVIFVFNIGKCEVSEGMSVENFICLAEKSGLRIHF